MTLSLHATTASARPAQLPDPAAADAQQTDSAETGDLFSDMLSMLGQTVAQDAIPTADGQADEIPAKDAADADANNALPGMSQSILSVMLTMPAALGASAQLAQTAPDIKSENAAPDMPLVSLVGNNLAPGELTEQVNVQTDKLNAGQDPVLREAVEGARIEIGKPNAGKDPALGEVVEKVRVEAGKSDAGKDPVVGEAVAKARVEADKRDARKDPASRDTAEKTYAQANALLDAEPRSTPDRPTVPRTTSGNAVVQEINAIPRAERTDIAVANQISRPAPSVQAPAAAFAGDVSEVKQQPVLVSATPGATVATSVVAQVVDMTSSAAPTPVVKFAGEPAQAGQQLLHALGDRIQFQVEKRSENATIRLDPPMMGRIEITVRHEAGSLQVQLSATNTEVVRQLQAIGDNLRQDLVQRHYGDVSVSVSDHTGNGRQQHQQEQAERERKHVGQALADAGQEDAAFTLASE